MNKIIHRADTRGVADHGWLHSFHTFSFAGYHTSERMGFGKLRVLNDDVVQPGQGFGTHPHKNMEIVSIPLKGALAHKDSVGNTQTIRAGEVQVMSAGTGITHSEFNASDREIVSFLQIWVQTRQDDIEPRYDQKEFSSDDRMNRFQPLVSPDGLGGSLVISQDAWFSRATIGQGELLEHEMHVPGNGVYLLVLEGEVKIAGETLKKRDAIGLENSQTTTVEALEDTDILCIEVPMVI